MAKRITIRCIVIAVPRLEINPREMQAELLVVSLVEPLQRLGDFVQVDVIEALTTETIVLVPE